MEKDVIYIGDCLETLKQLPCESVNMCVTSPPYYGLRDYGHGEQIGLEDTPEDFINKLVLVFREVKRVLKKDGTLWVNIGDTYAGSNCGYSSKPDAEWKSSTKNTSTIKSYNGPIKSKGGYKPKDMIGIPWMLAFALRSDGWYLRQDIIWNKPNSMPESVKDRCVKSHEYIFLLSKSKKYYFDYESIQEEATGYDGRKDTKMKGSKKYNDGNIVPNNRKQGLSCSAHERWKFRTHKNLQEKDISVNTIHKKRTCGEEEYYAVRNKRSVWSVNTQPFKGAHFAVFPPKLIIDCIKAGCPKGGIVLDPFMGSGTTAIVARKHNRHYIGCEVNPDYKIIQDNRILDELGLFQ